jgi:hypothetical protein
MFETRGVFELKNHEFFQKIDWDALAIKALTPPLKPPQTQSLLDDNRKNSHFGGSFHSEEGEFPSDFAGYSYVHPQFLNHMSNSSM